MPLHFSGVVPQMSERTNDRPWIALDDCNQSKKAKNEQALFSGGARWTQRRLVGHNAIQRRSPLCASAAGQQNALCLPVDLYWPANGVARRTLAGSLRQTACLRLCSTMAQRPTLARLPDQHAEKFK